jgi:hypothetical protein
MVDGEGCLDIGIIKDEWLVVDGEGCLDIGFIKGEWL